MTTLAIMRLRSIMWLVLTCLVRPSRGFTVIPSPPMTDPSSTIMSRHTTLQAVSGNNQRNALHLQTPHSGRHFTPSHPAYQPRQPLLRALRSKTRRRRKRFMEGWYYRLTLPDSEEQGGPVSFAFIMSIEDPGNDKSNLKLACIQVVGPNDEYLVQADRDDTKFWASKREQAFGYTFRYNGNDEIGADEHKYTTELPKVEWKKQVESGFQVLPDQLLVRVKGHDGSLGGVLDGQGVPGECSCDISIDQVLAGWGDANANTTQKSTAGWLASFAVFEPHWQVTMADARVSGTVQWKNKTYTFQHAPFYAEKNWGKALPSKWYWTQCNSFDGYYNDPDNALAVTAGGGIRQVPFGQQEALGMVSVHYQGKFYEAVPWTGTMRWKVDAWNHGTRMERQQSWVLYGKCTEGDRKFEVEISYKVDPRLTPGLVFRAPTPKEGMVYFCRDTFEAETTLSLWELEFDNERKEWVRKPGPPFIDQAKSSQGGAEIGGGPWWDTWENDSQLKRSFKIMLQAPYKLRRLFRRRQR